MAAEDPQQRSTFARNAALIIGAAAVLGIGVGALSTLGGGGGGGGAPLTVGLPAISGEPGDSSSGTPTSTPASPGTALTATLASFDPTPGGSGLAAPGAAGAPAGDWVTQHYKSAAFAGLKPGVGLVADLGTAQTVGGVAVDTPIAGTTVQLLTGDTAPVNGTPTTLTAASAPISTGTTATLVPTDHQPHRYWMVWITQLGADGQGTYWAAVSPPRITG